MSSERLELDDPQAYRDKLSALLGDQDPLRILAQTPGVLANLVAQRHAEDFRRRPFPDRWTWTPNEVLGHLVDTEWVFGFRVRAILCDECPALAGIDQERWVARQEHNARDPGDHVDAFRFLRRANLTLWKRLTPGDMNRVGQHAERGEESLATMLMMEAGHDLSHVDQLQRYLAVIDGTG